MLKAKYSLIRPSVAELWSREPSHVSAVGRYTGEMTLECKIINTCWRWVIFIPRLSTSTISYIWATYLPQNIHTCRISRVYKFICNAQSSAIWSHKIWGANIPNLIALVLYFCVKSGHKLSILKQYPFNIRGSCRLEMWVQCNWVLCSGSQKLKSRWSLGCGLIWSFLNPHSDCSQNSVPMVAGLRILHSWSAQLLMATLET